MDTTIRNLDEAAYRELKARAALEGKTIGEAANEAIRAYLATRGRHVRKRSLQGWKPEPYPPGNERLSMEVNKVYGPSDTLNDKRTTIELSEESRARLDELAAVLGEDGLSELVEEAVAFYLKHRAEQEGRIAEGLSALGSMNDSEAERLRDSVRRLRETWR